MLSEWRAHAQLAGRAITLVRRMEKPDSQESVTSDARALTECGGRLPLALVGSDGRQTVGFAIPAGAIARWQGDRHAAALVGREPAG